MGATISFTTDENNVLGKVIEEAGRYNVTIVSSSTAGTSNNGNDMLTLDYEVIDGKYVGGNVRYDNLTWVDDTEDNHMKSIKRFNTLILATGVKPGTQITGTIEQIRESLIGRKLNIGVEWNQNIKGNWNLQVRSHNLLDPEGSKPNGVMKPEGNASPASTGSFGSTAKAPSDPFATSTTAQISDDDLPF